MTKRTFANIITRLEDWRHEVLEGLRQSPTDEAVLKLKLELDAAIRCLEFCERHQISPEWQVIELPAIDWGSFAEFRLMWDYETEDRSRWQELKINGKPVRATPGDLLLCRPSKESA